MLKTYPCQFTSHNEGGDGRLRYTMKLRPWKYEHYAPFLYKTSRLWRICNQFCSFLLVQQQTAGCQHLPFSSSHIATLATTLKRESHLISLRPKTCYDSRLFSADLSPTRRHLNQINEFINLDVAPSVFRNRGPAEEPHRPGSRWRESAAAAATTTKAL